MAKRKKSDGAPGTAVAAPVVMPEWARELGPREFLFVMEFLKDFNQTKAYHRAFPGVTGGTAGTGGSIFRRRPNVSAAIELAMATAAGATLRTSIVEELAAIAFHDPGDYYDVDSEGEAKLKPMSEMDRTQRASIAGIKVKKTTSKDGDIICETELKLSDKQSALHKLATGLGVYKAAGGSGDAPVIAVQVIINRDGAEVL